MNENILHLELTFGNDNHLSLIFKKRLTGDEAEYLKRVFALALESIVEPEAGEGENEADSDPRP